MTGLLVCVGAGYSRSKEYIKWYVADRNNSPVFRDQIKSESGLVASFARVKSVVDASYEGSGGYLDLDSTGASHPCPIFVKFFSGKCHPPRLSIVIARKQHISRAKWITGAIANVFLYSDYVISKCRWYEGCFYLNTLRWRMSNVRWNKINGDIQTVFVGDGFSEGYFDLYPRPISSFELPSSGISRLSSSVGGFLSRSHLANIYQEQPQSYKDRRFFPKWCFVLALIIGFVGINWGIDNQWSRRKRLTAVAFSLGCILWMYGFAGILTWSEAF